MKIYIGTDHRGFELKTQIVGWLRKEGHDVVDCGNDRFEPEDDYVDFTDVVVDRLSETKEDALGILLCGSGVGVSIATNRHKGIFCGLGISPSHVKHIREKDHINVLALSADSTTFEQAQEMIRAFLSTKPSEEEKYLRRIQKIDK